MQGYTVFGKLGGAPPIHVSSIYLSIHINGPVNRFDGRSSNRLKGSYDGKVTDTRYTGLQLARDFSRKLVSQGRRDGEAKRLLRIHLDKFGEGCAPCLCERHAFRDQLSL